MARVRTTTRSFLAGYLRFVYGRASASSVPEVTPGFRRELMRERASVTPVERRRRPQVVGVEAFGRGSGVVLATTLIADGGIATYTLRITLRHGRFGWLVTGVDGG
jgi:hypothetical protein